ncbi:Peptidoglycan/LPS O-acetylase OafA/YrhL, contains acyltransferase and SGNH-hydrolase domains [Chitinophaga sp. CF118]|uniref:acyltransferase family protein n=1 Tax=Chitinophaga sp. CF118 TaxID=1884367 RepID=UPI0008ED4EE5|nr:acyltransferase [Chitinophaga sp. CF118]SFE92763.1 Peptidoglycan/LPS O-acetylase OafA/YrhL, contains acyltransferase and SGNH-hydrolase domains [Chitinophaga sp. CF118]
MRVHFKNLDAIRFIAALLVVLHHIQYFKSQDGIPSWSVLNYMLEDAGRVGVNLFFVLSGFLISYLLMTESSETGNINFKNFYIRRILRIWPLYMAYSLVLIVLSPLVMHKLGIPVEGDAHTILTNLLFMVLFAVNIQLAFFPYNKGIIEITWSVCIEEQFYLVWPLLLFLFKKRLKLLFLVMLSVGFLCKTLCLVLPLFFSVTTKQLFGINYVLLFDKLELFGMGMFAAYLLFNRETYSKFFKIILKPGIQWSMLIITVFVMLSIIKIPVLSKYYYDHFIHAALFGYLMLMAVAPNSILQLEYPLLKTLGKVSYGIYLFHAPVCQMLLIGFIKVFGKGPDILVYEIFYPLAGVITTCGIAYLSYELYEKHFLKLKTKYSAIQTYFTKKRLPLSETAS